MIYTTTYILLHITAPLYKISGVVGKGCGSWQGGNPRTSPVLETLALSPWGGGGGESVVVMANCSPTMQCWVASLGMFVLVLVGVWPARGRDVADGRRLLSADLTAAGQVLGLAMVGQSGQRVSASHTNRNGQRRGGKVGCLLGGGGAKVMSRRVQTLVQITAGSSAL